MRRRGRKRNRECHCHPWFMLHLIALISACYHLIANVWACKQGDSLSAPVIITIIALLSCLRPRIVKYHYHVNLPRIRQFISGNLPLYMLLSVCSCEDLSGTFRECWRCALSTKILLTSSSGGVWFCLFSYTRNYSQHVIEINLFTSLFIPIYLFIYKSIFPPSLISPLILFVTTISTALQTASVSMLRILTHTKLYPNGGGLRWAWVTVRPHEPFSAHRPGPTAPPVIYMWLSQQTFCCPSGGGRLRGQLRKVPKPGSGGDSCWSLT